MPDGALPVLDVKDLKTVFKTRSGEVHAVNSVSFDVKPGELLGVVGESGSGKSVTMMSLIGLLPSPPADVKEGQVLFGGQDLLKINPNDLRLPDHGAAAHSYGAEQSAGPCARR